MRYWPNSDEERDHEDMNNDLTLRVRIAEETIANCFLSIERNGSPITGEYGMTVWEVKEFFDDHQNLLRGEADPGVIWKEVRTWFTSCEDFTIPIADDLKPYRALGIFTD